MRVCLVVGLVGCLLLIPHPAHADGVREERPTLVTAELLGRGLLGSIDIEHYFNRYVGIGVGFGGFPCIDGSDLCNGFTEMIPLYVSVNPIGDVHSLYLSVGAVLLHDRDGSIVLAVFQAGYAMQLSGGFVLRPAAQLFVGGGRVLPWPSLAIGYSF